MLNFREAQLPHEQDPRLVHIIYNNQEVFSFHNKDSGYCDWLSHIILIMTDQPVYLPLYTMWPKIQREVHKHLAPPTKGSSSFKKPLHITGGGCEDKFVGDTIVWIIGSKIQLPSQILSHYHTLMKLYRWSNIANGSLSLTYLKGILSWQWQEWHKNCTENGVIRFEWIHQHAFWPV